jgi:hypothetical protein
MYDPARDIFTASEEAGVNEQDRGALAGDSAQNGHQKTEEADRSKKAESRTLSNASLEVWLTRLEYRPPLLTSQAGHSQQIYQSDGR